jgi:FAD/FMN-containing dehydrogenase
MTQSFLRQSKKQLITLLGNTHVSVLCPEHEKERGESVIHEIEKLAADMEGTVTGEHGIGLKLRDALVWEVGNNAVDAMRKVCSPDGIIVFVLIPLDI